MKCAYRSARLADRVPEEKELRAASKVWWALGEAEPNMASERREENRFKVGIGAPFPSPNATFRNTFTAR